MLACLPLVNICTCNSHLGHFQCRVLAPMDSESLQPKVHSSPDCVTSCGKFELVRRKSKLHLVVSFPPKNQDPLNSFAFLRPTAEALQRQQLNCLVLSSVQMFVKHCGTAVNVYCHKNTCVLFVGEGCHLFRLDAQKLGDISRDSSHSPDLISFLHMPAGKFTRNTFTLLLFVLAVTCFRDSFKTSWQLGPKHNSSSCKTAFLLVFKRVKI